MIKKKGYDLWPYPGHVYLLMGQYTVKISVLYTTVFGGS